MIAAVQAMAVEIHMDGVNDRRQAVGVQLVPEVLDADLPVSLQLGNTLLFDLVHLVPQRSRRATSSIQYQQLGCYSFASICCQ
jgi:hypothetical protein